MAGASDLPVYSINAPPSLPGIDFSDHLNYWQQGYPALMITDTVFPRSPHYRRATDTVATPDYARRSRAGCLRGDPATVARPLPRRFANGAPEFRGNAVISSAAATRSCARTPSYGRRGLRTHGCT